MTSPNPSIETPEGDDSAANDEVPEGEDASRDGEFYDPLDFQESGEGEAEGDLEEEAVEDDNVGVQEVDDSDQGDQIDHDDSQGDQATQDLDSAPNGQDDPNEGEMEEPSEDSNAVPSEIFDDQGSVHQLKRQCFLRVFTMDMGIFRNSMSLRCIQCHWMHRRSDVEFLPFSKPI